MNLANELEQIEDHLIPKLRLDHIERALYYHLLRHTRAIGKDASLFGLSSLAKSSGLSETTLRERIRILDEKGCVVIKQRSAKGHLLSVLLPAEIDGVLPKSVDLPEIDLDAVDFYSNRTYVVALVKREHGKCFYCLRIISADACVLDHVIPQMSKGVNSFRNVVASCHECNAAKQGQEPTAFFRDRYRKGFLSQTDLENRLETLRKLQQGELAPEI